MKAKGIIALAGVAAALGIAAHFAGGSAARRAPETVGERIVGDFDIAKVAKIDIGGKVVLAAGDEGWTIETMQGYPADRAKIAESLLKLQELKVGQVVRGKTLKEKTLVSVLDADGKPLASLSLGERHGNWGFGRYVEYKGQAVLTGEGLDAFGDDPKRWCETKIVDEPWISFNSLAEPGLDDATLGFATGIVAKVTIAGDTNRTITVGNKVGTSTDRYVKLDNSKWVFVVSSYSVDKFLPKDEPKKDAEPKKEAAPKKAEPKPAKPAPAAKPAKPAPAAKPAKPVPAAKPTTGKKAS